MLRSIATVSLGGGLQEKLYGAAAARFDAIEIAESDLTFYDGTPGDVRTLLKEVGVSVALFHGIADFDGLPEPQFAHLLERADRKFDLMEELGASLLLVTSGTAPTGVDEAVLASQLAILAERAAARGMRLGYQAVAWGGTIRTVADAWRIVSAAHHPNIGLVLNSFHALAAPCDLRSVTEIAGDRILFVQLADAPALDVDVATLGRHFRCFPGQGALDVAGFMAAVIATGYRGPVSLEVQNDEFRAAPARQTALEGMRSLTFVEEQLWRSHGAGAVTRFAAAPPPPVPDRESIGFIEFAASGRTGAQLEDWLRAMGFAPAGQHRTKNVTLFQQGNILIVLNAGTDTFAHYYHQLHGTSVCAIGLRTADPSALLARADLYLYKRYQERAAEQEYRMPAVRAPDGSLVHLLDDRYDPYQDFVRLDAAGIAPAGLTDVDHVVRAVPGSQFDSWVLFYRALLGLEPEAALELPDPHGFVRSQALHDHSNRVRLPLTFSESVRTTVARSLTTFGGAGVNQIAFGTADIFATVTSMQRNGVPLLPIPASYYRELRLERNVPDALATRLEEHNVLYDRDANGREFLHAYTEFFDSRFFFEVVQRQPGYARYGEVNAPVRMAAQAKRRVIDSAG